MTPSKIKITFHSNHPNAKLPTQAKDGDAGFDIYAIQDIQLKPHSVTVLETGISVANWETDQDSNQHFFLKIEGRSGLASKGIFPVGGIGDNSYRGQYKVALANVNSETYQIKTGDRIAQFVIYGLPKVEMVLDNTSEVMESERGKNGFGSTGI